LLSAEAVQAALLDFARLLRPQGLLLIQNRNDERLLSRGERFLPLSVHREGDREWLFFRFLDLSPERIAFHLATFWRDADGWHQRVCTTYHRPLPHTELKASLEATGFREIAFYGSWKLERFDPAESPDLVAVGRKGGSR
ncbi:MAG: hypothetical protein ACP5SI_07985, partial [Chloroflexia bacterium]